MSGLATEIIFLILKNLRSCTPTLRNASLVCRQFRVPSQLLLFKCISIEKGYGTGGSSPAVTFLNRISLFPHLASYIRELEIVDDEYPGEYRWLSDEDERRALVTALNMLQLDRIQRFTLKFQAFTWDEDPDSEITAVFMKICGSPNLECLNIVCAPYDFVHRCQPSLKHLSFWDPTPKETPDSLTQVSHRESPICLQSLSFARYHFQRNASSVLSAKEILEYLLDPHSQISLRDLRVLDLYAETVEDYQKLPKLLQCCQKSLQELCLRFIENPSGPGECVPLHLHKHANLRELEIHCLAPSNSNPLIWLPDELRAISHPNNLEKVTINIRYERSPDGQHDLRLSSWADIGTILANASAFPHLKLVDVILDTRIINGNVFDDDIHDGHFFDETMEKLERALTRLRDRSLLEMVQGAGVPGFGAWLV